MDYEPMLPKDLLKVASKLSKEEARKVIDQELSKPKQTNGLRLTPPQSIPDLSGIVWTGAPSGIPPQGTTWTTSSYYSNPTVSIQAGGIVSSNNTLGNPWEFRSLGQ